MENETNAMTRDEFWTQTVGNIQKDKAVTQQIEEAKAQFPELVSAFALLSAYVGYVHNRLDTARNVLGIDATFLPLSIPLPDGFCECNPLICQAIGGDADAAAILDGGNGHIPGSDGPVVGFDNCTLLKKRYDEL